MLSCLADFDAIWEGSPLISKMRDFFKRETVLCVSAVCAVLTMFLVPPDGA